MTPIQWMRNELRADLDAYVDDSNCPQYTQLAESCAAALGLDIEDPDHPVWDDAIRAFAPYEKRLNQ